MPSGPLPGLTVIVKDFPITGLAMIVSGPNHKELSTNCPVNKESYMAFVTATLVSLTKAYMGLKVEDIFVIDLVVTNLCKVLVVIAGDMISSGVPMTPSTLAVVVTLTLLVVTSKIHFVVTGGNWPVNIKESVTVSNAIKIFPGTTVVTLLLNQL